MLNKDERKIVAAVIAGGKVVAHYYNHHLRTYQKTGPADVYTKADIEAEETIIKLLGKHFAHFNVRAEESGYAAAESEYTFNIDPLDGTDNFVLGIPYFSTAVGLLKGKETIFSVIYQPLTNELYYAKKNQGAFKNDQKIFISHNRDITKSTLAYISGYSQATKLRPELMKKLHRQKIVRILDNWCPTLDYCLLAEGRIDCLINNDDDLQESSIGRLLIKEAGGVMVDFNGHYRVKQRSKKFVAANNKKILNQILPLVKT
jgi:myo-inositol-1(or 4)-monophosphatase